MLSVVLLCGLYIACSLPQVTECVNFGQFCQFWNVLLSLVPQCGTPPTQWSPGGSTIAVGFSKCLCCHISHVLCMNLFISHWWTSTAHLHSVSHWEKAIQFQTVLSQYFWFRFIQIASTYFLLIHHLRLQIGYSPRNVRMVLIIQLSVCSTWSSE